jgi:hypothetical protein
MYLELSYQSTPSRLMSADHGELNDLPREDETIGALSQLETIPTASLPTQHFSLFDRSAFTQYPSNEEVPYALGHMIANMLFGSNHYSQEEIKILAKNWVSWFNTMPTFTLRLLNSALELYETSAHASPEALKQKIAEEFAGEKTIDAELIYTTFHHIFKFMKEHPTMCVNFTKLVEGILEGVKEDASKAEILNGFLDATRTRTEITQALLEAGLALFKSTPNQMGRLVAHINNQESLVFSVMTTATETFKQISAQNGIKTCHAVSRFTIAVNLRTDLGERLIGAAVNFLDTTPEATKLIQDPLNTTTDAIKNHPILSRILINTIAPNVLSKLLHKETLRAGKLGCMLLNAAAERGFQPFGITLEQAQSTKEITEVAFEIKSVMEEVNVNPSHHYQLAVTPISSSQISPETPSSPNTPVQTSFKQSALTRISNLPTTLAFKVGEKSGAFIWNVSKAMIYETNTTLVDAMVANSSVKKLTLSSTAKSLVIFAGSFLAKTFYESAKMTFEEKYPHLKKFTPSFEIAFVAGQIAMGVIKAGPEKSKKSLQRLATHGVASLAGGKIANKCIKTAIVSPLAGGFFTVIIENSLNAALGIQEDAA